MASVASSEPEFSNEQPMDPALFPMMEQFAGAGGAKGESASTTYTNELPASSTTYTNEIPLPSLQHIDADQFPRLADITSELSESSEDSAPKAAGPPTFTAADAPVSKDAVAPGRVQEAASSAMKPAPDIKRETKVRASLPARLQDGGKNAEMGKRESLPIPMKEELSGPAWDDFRKSQPALAEAIMTSSACVEDERQFQRQGETAFQILRRGLRACCKGEGVAIDDVPGKAGIWRFLESMAAKRPVFRRQVDDISHELAGSEQWMEAKKSIS
eukprot:CAMPEP_0117545926 /NCGR_PEP_ID=MMETSP0784-20121206/46346_1 /TAXON_ID=39447 /ORGANISM="" /LENGTH=272 /DNA_ID=CAMNT_0005342787 /DNA_START=288 /DNA_END=1106 /DNA_ORIENTATION=-